MQEKIEKVMQGFDFEKVHAVMNLLKWNWNF